MRDEALTASGAEREAEYPPRKAHRSVLHGWPKQAMLGNWEVVWERLGPSGRFTGEGHRITRAERKRGKSRQAQVGLRVSSSPWAFGWNSGEQKREVWPGSHGYQRRDDLETARSSHDLTVPVYS